jgi:hypothetical protein
VITDAPVTWIRVEKPVFDLPGVILSSLGIAGLCALVAIVLGSVWGAILIRRSRRRHRLQQPDSSLTLRVIQT